MIENLEGEIWMQHPKYTEYAASNYGRIKHTTKKGIEKLNKLTPLNNGYLQFVLCKNGEIVDKPYVHRFVYECFHQMIIPKDRKKYQINHINEDKTDNRVFENLELVTAKQNINSGTHNERVSKSRTNSPKISKRVGQYTLQGDLVKIWKSIREAGRNGFNSGNISQCCNNKYFYNNSNNIYKGFIWKYIEE